MEDNNLKNRNESEDASLKGVGAALSRHATSIDVTPRPGFKEALFLRLREARRAHSMSTFSFRSLAPAAVTALVLIVVVAVVFQPFFGIRPVFAQDNFTLRAEASDAAGVAADSTYLLESRDPVSVADVKDRLSSNLDSAFELEQVSNRSIRISFEEAPTVKGLSADLVKFTLDTETTLPTGETVARPYGWAFQVKAPFRVEQTLPGSRSSGVPVDTGIEVTLNYENISVEDFSEAFSITPDVSGHVEQFRRTFVFVPDEALTPETNYTARLQAGLRLQGSEETLQEDYVWEFETGPLEWRGLTFVADEPFMTVVPGEETFIPVHTWSQSFVPVEERVQVSVYRFPDFDSYVSVLDRAQASTWQEYVSAADLTDISALSKAVSFETDIALETSSGYEREAVLFPESLQPGYYLVDLSYAGKSDWVLMSSSPLLVYTARGTDRTLAWVNSSVSDGPVEGATVGYVHDDERGTTDAQGLGFVPSREDQSTILEVRSGTEAMAIVLTGSVWMDGERAPGWARMGNTYSSADYWSYIYSDRPMYKTNDTVHFWGLIEKRGTGERPTQVTVSVGNVDEVVVDVSESGMFTGSMSFQDVPPGYSYLAVKEGENTLAQRGISIQDYVKPAYALSVTPDKDVIFAGESLGFTVHGELYEGTPMKGLELNASFYGVEQVVTLDGAGDAYVSFIPRKDTSPRPNWEYHDYPDGAWFSVRPTRSEEADIFGESHVMIFGSRVYLDAPSEDAVVENGVGQVKILARNVEPVYSWDPEEFAPTLRAGVPIQGKLVEITYDRIEEGTSYDFIRKTTVTNYRYQRVEKELQSFNVTTGADGSATYTFTAVNPEANYQVRLLAYDQYGMPDTTSQYVWQRRDFENWRNQELRFRNDDTLEGEDDPEYAVGDTVRLSVYRGEDPLEMPEGGRFLYFQAHQGLQETLVSKETTYQFPFEQRDVPNVGVYGILFLHDAYAPVETGWWWNGPRGYPVSYDTDFSKLSVEVTSDREDYRPGDEVKLDVRVTGPTGEPVEADVNVNVVDEAFYALVSEDVDPLSSLYHYVDEGIEAEEISAKADAATAMAEGGGGGGEARVDFRDTAAFLTLRTNAQGEAQTNFTLADDVTGWRITAQAIDLSTKTAGDTKMNIDATLPFFILPVMRESYLAGDEPKMFLRAAGTDVEPNDLVTYTVRVDSVGVEETLQAKAGTTAAFALPDLPLGTHAVDVEASFGSYKDRIVRPVTIVESRLVMPVISRVRLGERAVEGAPSGYTTVTFVDGNRGQYYSELESLASTFGDRADEGAVRVMATELLNEMFGEERETPSFVSAGYQDMAVRLLPYADTDLALTARLALFGQTPFSEDSMRGYFENGIYYGRQSDTEWDRLQVAQGYAGLAALGRPVLGEIQRLATEQDLSTEETLWVALGLQASGDNEGARVLYRSLVEGATEQNGYLFLRSNDLETTAEQTALLAVLSSALNEPQRDILHDYLVEQPDGNTLLVLEHLLFIKGALPHVPDGDAEVAYTLEGERRSEVLSRGSSLTIAVSNDELKALDARAVQGTVFAVSRYETPVVDPNAPVDERLALTRSYQNLAGEATNTFQEGELVRVVLNYDLPGEGNCGQEDTEPCDMYQVTDALPSGLVLATRPNTWVDQEKECIDVPFQEWKQRVSFFVTRSYYDCGGNEIVYYARVVTAGTYEAEPAYIRSLRDPNTHNHSASGVITITE